MSDYREYNYDTGNGIFGDIIQKGLDIAESVEIAESAEKHKEMRSEEIAERLLGKEAVTKEEIDELMGEYAGNETEYLVNGALLTCNRATRNPVKLTIDGQEHNFECPQPLCMDSTTLRVEENGQSSNGLYMATVGDTKMLDIIAGDKLKGKNIIPFFCNCSLPPDRKDEEDRIKNNLAFCKSRGTCAALMKLSDEWENVPSDTEYLSYKDNGVDKSAINMMSMLFCKHGGLITPNTSGQSVEMGRNNQKFCTNIFEFKKKYGSFLEEKAKGLGLDVNVLGAIIFTESNGGGFFDNGKLKIRFEDHIFLSSWAGTSGKYSEFFKHSATDYSSEAFLLNDVWIKTHSDQPVTEYQAFELAKTLDENAAYNAISMGLGQQMGFNYAACGYDSAKDMYDDYSKGELQQIIGTINFIKNYDNGSCLTAILKQDYKGFGLIYNNDGSYGDKIIKNIGVYKKA